MRVEFVFIPLEGKEPDHGLAFEMPGIPQKGDHVTITRPGQAGAASFIVRRIHWTLDYPGPAMARCGARPVVGTTTAAIVECEFEPGPFSFEEHKPAPAHP
ncbi:MAG: hypothetical protein OEY16_10315 [Alphaproteobacteria bacterium]|nr:hypothetical protein [Alphaproteobacteria bacterium]